MIQALKKFNSISKKARAYVFAALVIIICDKIGLKESSIGSIERITFWYLGAQGLIDSVLAYKGKKNG